MEVFFAAIAFSGFSREDTLVCESFCRNGSTYHSATVPNEMFRVISERRLLQDELTKYRMKSRQQSMSMVMVVVDQGEDDIGIIRNAKLDS
jgi:hypothetical protein